LQAAQLLGSDAGTADLAEAGEVLAARIESLMRATGMPNGVSGVGFANGNIPSLSQGAAAQRRLLANAPRPTGPGELEGLFAAALTYW